MILKKLHNVNSRRYFSMFIIILLLTNIISSGMNQVAFADDAISTAVKINSASMKINGVEVDQLPSLAQNADVVLSYNWEIEDGKPVNPGDYIEIDLPEALNYGGSEISGSLVGTMDNYGTWAVNPATKKLKIVMNKNPTLESFVHGTVNLNLNFRINEMTVDVPYIMSIPLSVGTPKSYTVNFKVPTVKDVIKVGTKNLPDINLFTWTIDINRNLKTLNPAVVVDVIDPRIDYKVGTMNIYPLIINSKGVVVKGTTPIEPSLYNLTHDPVTNELTITFNSAINSAYQLVYDTVINADKIDTSKTEFEYLNTATFNGVSDTAKVTITRGTLIEKAGKLDQAYNAGKITWSINVNKAAYPLKNVKVEDAIPTGLTLDAGSIKVYKMPGKVETFTPADFSVTNTVNTFEVNLGNINQEYLVEYDTEIADSTKFNNSTSISFINNASISQGLPGNVIKTPVTKEVSVPKGPALKKSGVAKIDYDEKYITWTVDVNLSEIDMGTSLYSDKIGQGQKLDTGTVIKAYPLTIDPTTGAVTPGTEFMPAVTPGIDPLTDFSIDFGTEIKSAYRIVYRTLITDKQTSDFKNDGYIGPNDGMPDVKATKYVEILNKFSKSNTGINYATNELDWNLTVDPIQKDITSLVITDTFNPELTMTAAQFSSLQVKRGGTEMNRGTEYTIVSSPIIPTNGKIKGFLITFTDPVQGAIYTVDYKTDMDADVLTNNGNLTYLNTAKFDFAEGTTTKTAKPTIQPIVKNNGNKSGALDATNKKINWTMNTNHLSKTIDGFEITDNMLGNQKLVAGSIIINNYTLNPAGEIILGALVNASDAGFVITEAVNGSGFVIKYPTSINSPYRITYSTEFVGISQTAYENTAVTNKNQNYVATVPYADGNEFISKIGTLNGEESVTWTVTLNKSKSTISSYKLTDTLSEGLELIENSFVIKKLDGTPGGAVVDFNAMLTLNVRPRALTTDPQVFDLISKVQISDTYIIEYKTRIIKDEIIEKKVSNNVEFNSVEVTSGVRQATKEIATSFVTGSGTGVGEVGSFVLKKVDEQGTPLKGVKFEFFKGVNLLGILETDVNGEITVSRLKYATYSVKEIAALEGYQIVNEKIDFTINNIIQKTITVINHKLRTLEIVKTEKDKPTEFLANAEFEIRNASDVLLYTKTTDSNGKISVNLPYGTYKVKETKAPAGYIKDDKEQTVIIAEGDLQEDESLKMIYTVNVENTKIIDTKEPAIAKIVDYVWHDENENGKKDPNEKGIPGVKVILTDSEGNTKTTTTDSTGKYIFENLELGKYVVTIDKTTLPKDFKQTYELDNTIDNKVEVILSDAEYKEDVVFGYNISVKGNYNLMPAAYEAEPGRPLPNTGTENYNLLLGGILMLLLSSGFLMLYRRKES